MAEIKISCPHCSQHIQCDDSYCDKQIDCPSCQQPIFVTSAKTPKQKSHKNVVAKITAENRAFFEKLDSECKGITIQYSAKEKIYAAAFSMVLVVAFLFFGTIGAGYFGNHVVPAVKNFNIGNLVPAAFKKVTVHGTVYVKLNSGESVPLSMVTVAVYDDEFISNKMVTLNQQITKEKQSSESKDILEGNVRVETMLALNNGLNLWGGAVVIAETDKDGKFTVTLPRTGHYSFFAISDRNAPANRERYFFFRRGNLDTAFGTYTADLNNEFEEVGKFTEGWTDETLNSFDDQTLFNAVVYSIMTREYGLQDVSN